jgi:hypothetical protein
MIDNRVTINQNKKSCLGRLREEIDCLTTDMLTFESNARQQRSGTERPVTDELKFGVTENSNFKVKGMTVY